MTPADLGGMLERADKVLDGFKEQRLAFQVADDCKKLLAEHARIANDNAALRKLILSIKLKQAADPKAKFGDEFWKEFEKLMGVR